MSGMFDESSSKPIPSRNEGRFQKESQEYLRFAQENHLHSNDIKNLQVFVNSRKQKGGNAVAELKVDDEALKAIEDGEDSYGSLLSFLSSGETEEKKVVAPAAKYKAEDGTEWDSEDEYLSSGNSDSKPEEKKVAEEPPLFTVDPFAEGEEEAKETSTVDFEMPSLEETTGAPVTPEETKEDPKEIVVPVEGFHLPAEDELLSTVLSPVEETPKEEDSEIQEKAEVDTTMEEQDASTELGEELGGVEMVEAEPKKSQSVSDMVDQLRQMNGVDAAQKAYIESLQKTHDMLTQMIEALEKEKEQVDSKLAALTK